MTVSSEDVKTYYDEFSKTVLLNGFRGYSPRQEAVKKLCDDFIAQNSKVLEVGCGTGIITAHVAKSCSLIVGVDITEVGLKIARAFVNHSNSHFYLADLTKSIPDELKEHAAFDYILLADVIEHIPLTTRPMLLANLESLLSANGQIILTFPSVEYQNHLREKNPEGLQVVDEDVKLGQILSETSLLPYYYSYKKIWHDNMYNHLVLSRTIQFLPKPIPFAEKAFNKIKGYIRSIKYYFFLKKIKRVL